MNYLAHVYLSSADPYWQLGGYLGDFVKGPLRRHLPDTNGDPWCDSVVGGIKLHRKLDAHVDSWEPYIGCLDLVAPEYRRWGGVAIDVFFDHLLAKHWSRYSPDSLLAFSRAFYSFCDQQSSRLPQGAGLFIRRAAQYDIFCAYADKEVFINVLERIDQRVRFKTNLVSSGQALLNEYDELESRFLAFMPVLIDHADKVRQQIILE